MNRPAPAAGSVALWALAAGTGATGMAPNADAGSDARAGFRSTIVPLLKERCVGCHLTGEEPGGLALHPNAAYRNLVDVPSVESPLMRVRPGDPARSYLWRKLEGTHREAGGGGERMPLDQPPLDASALDTIRRWIEAGAVDD